MVRILGPGPFKVRGARWIASLPWSLAGDPVALLQGWNACTTQSACELRKKSPLTVGGDPHRTRRDQADRGQAPGLVTYPSLRRRPLGSQESPLPLFSPACLLFILFPFSFVAPACLLPLPCVCPGRYLTSSGRFQSILGERARAGLGRTWSSRFSPRPSEVGEGCWGQGLRGAPMDLVVAWLPLDQQGLGYDHDRMAAALRFYSAKSRLGGSTRDIGGVFVCRTKGRRALRQPRGRPAAGTRSEAQPD